MKNLKLKQIFSSLLDIIMPRTCIACGRRLALQEEHLCLYCLSELPRTHYSNQRKNPLADRFNDLIQRDLDKEDAEEGKLKEGERKTDEEKAIAAGEGREDDAAEKYSYATALFFYRSDYKKITQSLKYHANLEAGRYFSAMLAKEMAGSELFADVDLTLPVPLHWSRRWSRGHNQAETIASVISKALGADMRTDLLVRARKTKSQAKLSIGEKAQNVQGAFRLKAKREDFPSEYRHILIVDDVFTTGATLHSCFLAVREFFPASVRISVAALACISD